MTESHLELPLSSFPPFLYYIFLYTKFLVVKSIRVKLFRGFRFNDSVLSVIAVYSHLFNSLLSRHTIYLIYIF